MFAELICALPCADENIEPRDSLPDESLFLIGTSDPWYGDILLYLQTQRFQPNISCEERRRIRHHSRRYLILDDTLYLRGIDTILQHCLTHEKVERVLNDCHLGSMWRSPFWDGYSPENSTCWLFLALDFQRLY